MLEPQSSLAAAFLALSDEGEAPPQRSLAHAACALAAGMLLALGAPLAWTVAAEGRPADQPVATLAGKAALADDEPDDAGE
jgi:hypothetical protein